MNPTEQYLHDRDEQAKRNRKDKQIKTDVVAFMDTVHRTNYVKNFAWMGRPILQLPQDMIAMQEIIWEAQPDLIIETGVAFGGSMVFYASILEAIGGQGQVIAIDIDIREHNRAELSEHPLCKRFVMLSGSSTDDNIIKQVKRFIREAGATKILVALDSNHTHEHVLRELELYAPLVSLDSYIVVFDTSVEYLDPKYIPEGRPWGKGNNPMTAVREFMKGNFEFKADTYIENRILLTSAVGGWLKRIKEVT